MSEFIMKSENPAVYLKFSEWRLYRFDVELKTPSLSIHKTIENYSDRSSSGFAEFFEKLANYSSPWAGEEVWKPLDGQFELASTCTALGQVTMKIHMSNYVEVDNWRVDCDMLFGFGSLQQIASDARRFAV